MLFILVKKIDEDCYLFTHKKNIGFCDKVTSVCEEYIGKVFPLSTERGSELFLEDIGDIDVARLKIKESMEEIEKYRNDKRVRDIDDTIDTIINNIEYGYLPTVKTCD